MNYGSELRREPPRLHVFITNIDVPSSTALGKDVKNQGLVTIDLKKQPGQVVVWPRIGEEWYCIKIDERWVLERKGPVGNEGLSTPNVSPGDQVLNVGGSFTTTTSKDLNQNIGGNVNTKVTGTINMSDSLGNYHPRIAYPWVNLPLRNGVTGTTDPNYYKGLRWMCNSGGTAWINGVVTVPVLSSGQLTMAVLSDIPTANRPTNYLPDFAYISTALLVGSPANKLVDIYLTGVATPGGGGILVLTTDVGTVTAGETLFVNLSYQVWPENFS